MRKASWRFCAALIFLLPGLTIPASAEPVRLSDLLDLADWLKLSGSYRIRYEGVANGFRPIQAEGDRLLAERLLLRAEINLGAWQIGAEFEDSRTQLGDDSTPLGTDDVNTAELLEGYVAYHGKDLFGEGERFDLKMGRMTLNIGSRRLSSRNGFRNTINSFTGIHGVWQSRSGLLSEAFFTLPVRRLPSDPGSLRDNDVRFDNESFRVKFWGVRIAKPALFADFDGEIYVFGLNERDGPRLATADRALYTPGFRLERAPRAGGWDAGIESALQFGKVGSVTDMAELPRRDQRAGFVHLHLGYRFDRPWSPRLSLFYDFASGDDDPEDGKNNRFDTLFGSRGFEFGQTGIFGPFARANISSPGALIEVVPQKGLSLSLRYRANWLASARDALTTAGLRDPDGESGHFVGHLLEGKMRYDVLPGNLRLELGGVWLGDGRFLKLAPGAPQNGAALYGYVQATISF
ncbi:MAG: hypothetical protein Tsb008_01430 [Rhodothalassiaceae bacterium]